MRKARQGGRGDHFAAGQPNHRLAGGGKLRDCYLRNYQAVRTGIGDFTIAENKLLAGDIMVRAGGSLLVGNL